MGLFSRKKKPLSVTLKTGFAGSASGVEITIRAYQQSGFMELSWGHMSDEQIRNVLTSLAEDSRQAIVRGLSSYQQVGPAEFAAYSRDKRRD